MRLISTLIENSSARAAILPHTMKASEGQQYSEERRMSIAWSLQPISIYMKFCGIPTCFQPRKSFTYQRAFEYFWRIV